MATNAWRLLGFDAREDPKAPFRGPIPLEVREELLLRPEIESPLSVDGHIWPTLFHYYPHVTKALGEAKPGLIEVDPDCDGGLWLNLGRMWRRLQESKQRAVAVAIELLAPEGISVREFPSPLIYSLPDPGAVPEGSLTLGHDVADAGFCSGLSNCGYTREERDSLRPRWQDRINDFGLIPAQDAAREFRELSDRRVPEHAPFWVFRLHRLPEV